MTRTAEAEPWDDRVGVPLDEVLLTSSWSTPVPLGSAPWGHTHAPTVGNALPAGAAASPHAAGDAMEEEEEEGDDDDDKARPRLLAGLLSQLEEGLLHAPGGPLMSARASVGARRGSGAGPAAAAGGACSDGVPGVDEPLAAALVDVLSRLCLDQEDEEDQEGMLQYMVWSRTGTSSSSSLSLAAQQQQRGERFFVALCQLMTRRDVSVVLFTRFLTKAVLPRLASLKVRPHRRASHPRISSPLSSFLIPIPMHM